MCGIFGCVLAPSDIAAYDTDENSRWSFAYAMKVLGLHMETRGQDSTGMVTVNDGRFKLRKAAVPATRFFKDRAGIGLGAHLVLGHTRHGTQGTATNPLNNHPIQYDNIVGVHNGIIYNDYSLFREEKWDRHGDVDSEAIFAAIKHAKNPVEALEMIEGWMAIAWIDKEDPDRLWLAKGNSSPLHIAYTEAGSLFFASTAAALQDLAKYKLIVGHTWDDGGKIHNIDQAGWLMSYKPKTDSMPDLSRTFTPKATRSFTPSSYSKYASDWTYDWSLDEWERRNSKSLAEAVLGTHSTNVDTLVDPFDEVAAADEPMAVVVRNPDERVTDRKGRVGTVRLVAESEGLCLVEWDDSVEDFEDLFEAHPEDEFDAMSAVANFMAPSLLAVTE